VAGKDSEGAEQRAGGGLSTIGTYDTASFYTKIIRGSIYTAGPVTTNSLRLTASPSIEANWENSSDSLPGSSIAIP
jgi:hypothetical protein